MKKIQLDVLNLDTKERIRCNFCGDIRECVIGASPVYLTHYEHEWDYNFRGEKIVLNEEFKTVEQPAGICHECVDQLKELWVIKGKK